MPSLLIVPPITHVLEHELSEVRRRLRIDSETQYTMDGKTKDYQPRSNRFFTVPQGLPGIVGHMAQLVYDTFYTRRNQGRGSYAFVPDAQLQRRYWERL